MLNSLEAWLKRRIRQGSFSWTVLNRTKDVLKVTPVALPVYRKISKDGTFIFKDELEAASSLPAKILDRTMDLFSPKTVLDLGCGTGRSLDYFLARDVDVTGVEGSKMAISAALHPQRIVRYDLRNELDLGRKFDLVWSFEFVEHIHPEFVDNLIRSFSNHSDRLVISAARPGQGGNGHFNEQPAAYWIEKFALQGYVFDSQKSEELRAIDEEYAPNMLVFTR